MKNFPIFFAAATLAAACTQSASAGPLDPPKGQYACSQSQIVANILPGLPTGTSVQTGPAPFGDLTLDGSGRYSFSSGSAGDGRYASNRDTGALTFTGLLAAFGNTYEVKSGVAFITFQSASITFSCSQKSSFPGSFSVSTPMPGASADAKAATGPLNGAFSGTIYFTKPEGLFAFDLAKGTETFVREAGSFDRSAKGEFVWVNRAGELMTGADSGPVKTLPVYGRSAAPKFSRDGQRIAYVGETPPASVEEAMMGAHTSANLQPLVIDRQGNVVAAFGAQFIDPQWTADGRVIMAGAKAAGSLAGSAQTGIFLSDPSLRSVERIDPGMELPHSPAVSPDGLKVAFFSAGRIYVMDIEGGDTKVIAGGKSPYVGSIAWSPSGDAIAFRDNEQIKLAKLDGTVEPLKAPGGVGVYAKSNITWIRD